MARLFINGDAVCQESRRASVLQFCVLIVSIQFKTDGSDIPAEWIVGKAVEILETFDNISSLHGGIVPFRESEIILRVEGVQESALVGSAAESHDSVVRNITG